MPVTIVPKEGVFMNNIKVAKETIGITETGTYEASGKKIVLKFDGEHLTGMRELAYVDKTCRYPEGYRFGKNM